MHYGFQLSVSGAVTSLYRQNVLANNLANADTPGFKPDIALARQRDPVRAEDGVWSMPSNRMLEKLGAGALMAPNSVSFAQGRLVGTGDDLDLAIDGAGFIPVRVGPPEGGEVHLTRDGRMALDERGRLVMRGTGHAVLNRDNGEIFLDGRAQISVMEDGRIVERRGDRETVAGFIGLVDVADRRTLRKRDAGLFLPDATTAGGALQPSTSGKVRQGFVEQSSVNEIRAMMSVQQAGRHAQSNIAMIGYADRLLDQAINRFARTA